MAVFLLVPGAGGDARYWDRVVPLLEADAHEAIAVELPSADDSAGLDRYLRTAVGAIDAHRQRTGTTAPLVVVGQSMGAYTAASVAARLPVALLLLVAPMVPLPGESPGQWWEATGQENARRADDEKNGRDPDAPFDALTTFLHDVPPTVIDEIFARGERPQSGTPFGDIWREQPWPLRGTPTRVLAGRNDRFFPLDLVQRLARERLGIEADIIDSGHLPAFGHPLLLAEYLLDSARSVG